jgi:hypothetical protein
MGWYKFKISNEQMAPVETQRIQKKFDQIWWPLSGPKGTAVYARKTTNGQVTSQGCITGMLKQAYTVQTEKMF